MRLKKGGQVNFSFGIFNCYCIP